MFAVQDVKVGAYLNPFTMRSKGEAIRTWSNSCDDPNTQFFKTPSDFTLCEIGEYNEVSGKLIPHDCPLPIGTALEFKTTKKEESSAVGSA